ncbi:MAG: hypothetical protein ACP5NQ_04290 [Vulcanisaeta sp.]
MELKTVILMIIITLLIVMIMVIVHQLHIVGIQGNITHDNATHVNNAMNTQVIESYNDKTGGINYTVIIIEREAIARNRHIVRLCNG